MSRLPWNEEMNSLMNRFEWSVWMPLTINELLNSVLFAAVMLTAVSRNTFVIYNFCYDTTIIFSFRFTWTFFWQVVKRSDTVNINAYKVFVLSAFENCVENVEIHQRLSNLDKPIDILIDGSNPLTVDRWTIAIMYAIYYLRYLVWFIKL